MPKGNTTNIVPGIGSTSASARIFIQHVGKFDMDAVFIHQEMIFLSGPKKNCHQKFYYHDTTSVVKKNSLVSTLEPNQIPIIIDFFYFELSLNFDSVF